MQKVIELLSEIERMSDDCKHLRDKVILKEQELCTSKETLAKYNEELDVVKKEFERVSLELEGYNTALMDKEQQLSEMMNQNKSFIRLLHQSELESKAEDVLLSIKQCSEGKKSMSAADWKQLYHAVDELYPKFKERILKELKTFTEQQIQVCYLMRIGLDRTQIQNMTNLSRVTVWRWTKKYDWVLMSDEEELDA